jgi:competence CoiA-like predicted nuclease
MEITPKTSYIFNCINCDFKCSKQSDWNRHILTAKHQKRQNFNNLEQNYAEKTPIFLCPNCNKSYKARTSLWYHKQKCNTTNCNDSLKCNSEFKITPQMFYDLLKQNNELQKSLIELAKEKGPTNNTINSNNKTFNLQVFLNETCKDAINLTDFVNQIQVSISDLEETGKLGYAEGISKVFIKNLNDIDYSNRPIHCSDSKRETLYIKDDNQWFKDDEQKTNLTKAIKQVAHKNIKQISEWQKLNPHYSEPESKQNV